MGFTSFTCAKTNLPVLASISWGGDYPEMCDVVILYENGDKISGGYDGYGRVDGHEILDAIDSGQAKAVLKKFYANESFSDLGKSERDPGQGHFHDEQKIVGWLAAGGFRSYADFTNAYNTKTSPPVLDIVLTRISNDGTETEIKASMCQMDGIVMSGSDWHPGFVFEGSSADAMSDFEREWIFLSINEGSMHEGQTDPDEDEDGSYLKFKAIERDRAAKGMKP